MTPPRLMLIITYGSIATEGGLMTQDRSTLYLTAHCVTQLLGSKICHARCKPWASENSFRGLGPQWSYRLFDNHQDFS